MPYYLAPLIGNGTDQNKFRPRGSDGQVGWKMVDLRPDGGATLGGGGLNACLLWLPIADSDPQLKKIADSADEILSQALINQINNFLGTSLVPDTLGNVVGAIMMNPPTGKWKKLEAVLGKFYEVWLNGRIFFQPTIQGGATWSYDFNQADDPNNWGTSWIPYEAGGTILEGSIANNRARAKTTTEQSEQHFADFAPDSPDQFAQCDIVTWNGGDNSDSSIGVLVRGGAGPTREFYQFLANREPIMSRDGWSLFKRVAGAFTELDHNDSDPFVAGNKIQIQVVGSTITGYRNYISLTTQTDTAITDSIRGGMRVGNLTNIADTEADNFFLGDGPLPGIEFGGQVENHPFASRGVSKSVARGARGGFGFG